MKDRKKTRKRKCNKKVTYAESDSESDIKAETKVPEKRQNLKNYPTSLTNDEPTWNQPVTNQLYSNLTMKMSSQEQISPLLKMRVKE